VAIAKAAQRSKEAGRGQKIISSNPISPTTFRPGTTTSFCSETRFYYVPVRKIQPMLERYSGHTVGNGCLHRQVVGGGNEKDLQIVEIVENNFVMVESVCTTIQAHSSLFSRPEKAPR